MFCDVCVYRAQGLDWDGQFNSFVDGHAAKGFTCVRECEGLTHN